LLVVAGCSSTAPTTTNTPSNAAPPASAEATAQPADPQLAAPASSDDPAREVCEAVIAATRPCKDLYLPALLRTRAKYDQPPGIAERYRADGEAKLLAIASEEFDADFSKQGIAARCDAMMAEAKTDRDAIAAREKRCLSFAGDCAAFVECNVKLLEDKWDSPSPTDP
jgi:hypothetical protein